MTTHPVTVTGSIGMAGTYSVETKMFNVTNILVQLKLFVAHMTLYELYRIISQDFTGYHH